MSKFKAWDKVNKQWINDFMVAPDGQVAVWNAPDYDTDHSDNYDLYEYTYQTDKNKKEIHDGSIVEIKNTKRFIKEGNITCISRVKMHEGHVYVWTQPIVKGRKIRYGAHELYDGLSKYIDMKGVATSDVRVSGHICENPELLKES